ncbi:PepSY domain-containing protein [Roseomonas hellenica]|uniref:PepSY domain-containing protein n=1 Tax=Plastoroseomonas hellenica TaxID=2687306 RepID=A0ABS5EZ82_9PROT|nr:PepSY-associated TM helix domain-containing protein [Plastoroseomonas hellenica]MBR0665235.1 PepSY domain-containing protein [Plastoroseomonas hellenica]
MDATPGLAGAATRAAPGTASPAASRGFRLCLWLHRWTGLIATPFFLILCLTGSILIFKDEVAVLLGDQPALGDAAGAPQSLAALVEAAQRQRPGLEPMSAWLPVEAPDRAIIGLRPPGAAEFEASQPVLLDRATAAPMPFSNPEKTLTGFLLELHARWFAGVAGEIFGGIIALLVLISLITGVIVHAPYVRRLAFGTVRHGRGARIVQLDLHNLVGVVVLGWAVLVTVTGISLAAGHILLHVWQDTELREMAGHADAPVTTPVSVDIAAEAARRAMPGAALNFAIWPGTELSSPRHYTFLMYGAHRYDKALFDVVLVDAETATVAAARPLPLYLKLVVLSGPLHFGDYGGLALKIFWFASAWATLFITGNGAWLWWRRRRGIAA